MNEGIIPLRDFMQQPDFLTAEPDGQLTAINGYFKKMDSVLDDEEREGEAYLDMAKTRIAAREPFLRLKYGKSIQGSLPDEAKEDPDNINYMATYLQRYFGASDGGAKENFSMPPLRTTLLTEDEVMGFTRKALNGETIPGILPSDKKRIAANAEKQGYNLDPSQIVSETDEDQSEENLAARRANGFFHDAPGFKEAVKGPMAALKEAYDDQVELRQSSSWSHVNDDTGTLFSFRRVPAPGKNVWEMRHAGMDAASKPIRREFGGPVKNEELLQFARDTIPSLTDADDSFSLGVIPTGLSSRERAESLIGSNDRSKWGELVANSKRNILALVPKTIGGAAGSLSAAGEGLYEFFGGDASHPEDEPGIFEGMATAYNHVGDTIVRGSSQTSEDRKLEGLAKFADPSSALDAVVNFGATVAQVVITKKSPMTGIGLLGSQAASASYMEIMRSNLESGVPMDVASRRAAFGGMAEGSIVGAIQYATGRLIAGGGQIPGLRDLIAQRLAVTAESSAMRSFLAGRLPGFASALPVTLPANALGGIVTRFASNVIQDIANPEDDLGSTVAATFTQKELEDLRGKISSGIVEDLVLGVLGDAVLQTNPRVSRLPSGAAKLSTPLNTTNPVLKSDGKFFVKTGSFNAEFVGEKDAALFSRKLDDIDALREATLEPVEGQPGRFKRRADVTEEEFSAYQSEEQKHQEQLDQMRGFQINRTTDPRVVSQHDNLPDAISEAKAIANEFSLGRDKTIDQQKSDATERFMDKFSRRTRDYTKERAQYKANLMAETNDPRTAGRIDTFTGERARAEADLAKIPEKSSDEAVKLQQKMARLDLLIEKTRNTKKAAGMKEEDADAAADLYVKGLQNKTREIYRPRASAMAEMLYGRQNPRVSEGAVEFDILDPELARSISDSFEINERIVTNADGTNAKVYDLAFRQPTGGEESPGTARQSAAAIEQGGAVQKRNVAALRGQGVTAPVVARTTVFPTPGAKLPTPEAAVPRFQPPPEVPPVQQPKGVRVNLAPRSFPTLESIAGEVQPADVVSKFPGLEGMAGKLENAPGLTPNLRSEAGRLGKQSAEGPVSPEAAPGEAAKAPAGESEAPAADAAQGDSEVSGPAQDNAEALMARSPDGPEVGMSDKAPDPVTAATNAVTGSKRVTRKRAQAVAQEVLGDPLLPKEAAAAFEKAQQAMVAKKQAETQQKAQEEEALSTEAEVEPVEKSFTETALGDLPAQARSKWTESDLAALDAYGKSGDESSVAGLSGIKRARAIRAFTEFDPKAKKKQEAKDSETLRKEDEQNRPSPSKVTEGEIESVLATDENGVSDVTVGGEPAFATEDAAPPKQGDEAPPEPVVSKGKGFKKSNEVYEVKIGENSYQMHKDPQTGMFYRTLDPSEQGSGNSGFIGTDKAEALQSLQRRDARIRGEAGSTILFGELIFPVW